MEKTLAPAAPAHPLAKPFNAGDEVISACGSMAGVILSISGTDALVSWSCRGKSTEALDTLAHIEHTA